MFACTLLRDTDTGLDHQPGAGRSSFELPDDAGAGYALRAGGAGGGGVLVLDVFEHPEPRLLVNEVKATMEFRNSIEPTRVNILARIVESVLELAHERAERSGGAEPSLLTAAGN